MSKRPLLALIAVRGASFACSTSNSVIPADDIVLSIGSTNTVERPVPGPVILPDSFIEAVTLPVSSAVEEVAIDKNELFPDVNRKNNIWRK